MYLDEAVQRVKDAYSKAFCKGENCCDCSGSAAGFVMRYCKHDIEALKDLHEICNKDPKEIAELAKNIIKGENEMYLDEVIRDKELKRKLGWLELNAQYGISPSGNANAYSKAFVKFYNKESEELADFIKKIRDGDGHVVRDRVNQVDLAIKKVIFNDPATIILWKDGSKTVVKCGDHEKYDPEKGFAMALAKRYLGNLGRYYELFKRHLPEKTFTSDDDEVLVRAKLVGPLSPKKGNTKYIVKLPGHAAAVSLDKEYLVEVEE